MCVRSTKCVLIIVLHTAKSFFLTIGMFVGLLFAGFLGAVAVLWAVYLIYVVLATVNPGIIVGFIFGTLVAAALYDKVKEYRRAKKK